MLFEALILNSKDLYEVYVNYRRFILVVAIEEEQLLFSSIVPMLTEPHNNTRPPYSVNHKNAKNSTLNRSFCQVIRRTLLIASARACKEEYATVRVHSFVQPEKAAVDHSE